MKKVKGFLLIIFILLFLINNIFIPKKNNFINLQIQTEYDKYTNNQDTAVSILKPTLTLYYDRYDVNSKYFYDDTRTLQIKNILIQQEQINNLDNEFEFLKDTFNTIIKDGLQKIYKHDKGKEDESYNYPTKIDNYEIIWYSHFCFRTTTKGRSGGNNEEDDYVKNDYLLTRFIEKNLYKSLRLSEYDFEEFITLFEAVRTHLDTYKDLFNKYRDVNRSSAFKWHSDDRFNLRNTDTFNKNSAVNKLNDYLENRYKILKEGFVRKKNTMMDNMIERNNLGVWNQIKLLYETEDFPYLNHKLLTLEEIYCQDGEMPTCISNEITAFKKDKEYYKELYEVETPSSSPTDSPELLEEEIVIDFTKTRQFPRNDDLVDKLPKVIFTYQKYEYDGLIDGVNTKLIEYDGIYNINNEFVKKGRNNILKFLVDMMEENLEIKQGGDKDGKIYFHNDNINNIIENKEKEEHKFSNIITNNITEDIKMNPNFDLDFNSLNKCDKCSEFIKN
jgi:hypothetical protein